MIDTIFTQYMHTLLTSLTTIATTTGNAILAPTQLQGLSYALMVTIIRNTTINTTLILNYGQNYVENIVDYGSK